MENHDRMSILDRIHGSLSSILHNFDENQTDDQPETEYTRVPIPEADDNIPEVLDPRDHIPDSAKMDDLKDVANFHDDRNIFGSNETIFTRPEFQRLNTVSSTVSSRAEIINSVCDSLRIPRLTLFIAFFLIIAHFLKNFGKNRLIFTMLYCNDTNIWTGDTLLSFDMLTYAASHDTWSHLVTNILTILLFGAIIEQCLGSSYLGFLFLFSVYIGGLGALISGDCKYKTGSDGQLEGGLLGASGGAFGLLPVILYLILPLYQPSTSFFTKLADFMYCDQKNSRFRKYGRHCFICLIVLFTAVCFWLSVGPKVAVWTHVSGYLAGLFLALAHFICSKLLKIFKNRRAKGRQSAHDNYQYSNRDSSVLNRGFV